MIYAVFIYIYCGSVVCLNLSIAINILRHEFFWTKEQLGYWMFLVRKWFLLFAKNAFHNISSLIKTVLFEGQITTNE